MAQKLGILPYVPAVPPHRFGDGDVEEKGDVRRRQTVLYIPDTATLMALEGNVRDQYYRAFNQIIGLSDFVFESRTRGPPKNRLNALISFGNSLLYTICLSEIYRTHLDPRIGFCTPLIFEDLP